MKYLVSFVSLFAFLTLLAVSLEAQPLTYQHSPVPCINRSFTVVAHIVRDTFGEPNIMEEEITDAFALLNEDFAPICAKFEICDIRYIDNFQYDEIEDEDELNEMYTYYNDESRINMYFISSSDEPFCGIATLGGIAQTAGNPGIAILKGECMAEGTKTISHEMGHYFGLLHTFEGSDGANPELVDGSNCETAGDLICDTPADPYVAGDSADDYVNLDMDCRFIRQIKDGNDEWFVPDVGNIMSYYQSACACGFTHGQYLRMANTYLDSVRGNW